MRRSASFGDKLKRTVFESDVLFTDDSITPLQVKGTRKGHKTGLWVYVWGGTNPPLIVADSDAKVVGLEKTTSL